MPAATTSKTIARVPFLVADSFVLALDDFMRRTHQGGHVSQSVIELDGPPDPVRLRDGLRRAVAKFPLLAAQARRHWRTRLPYWAVPATPLESELPFGWWREGEIAPGSPFADATPTADVWKLVQWLSNEPLVVNGMEFNARVDAVARRDGRFWLLVTWSHLLFDGKGAELFCAELARLCDGIDLPEETARSAAPRPRLSWLAKFRRTKPAMDYQTGLQETGVPSLGGPKPRPGNANYQILTFEAADSAAIRSRAEQLGGGLFPITFFVACVARAHDRVFRHRGQRPAGYGISVPTQTRKRGAKGPLFHNHVAPLFFNPRREHLATVAETAAAMKAQFAVMVRAKVAESFDIVLDLMRPLPSRLFMGIIRAQFKGELCTCYSSHTGSFAPETKTFAGADVTNAYHLPCLGTPPGTGIFFGEHGERLNVTLTWRDGALTDEERALMVTQLHDDLLGL